MEFHAHIYHTLSLSTQQREDKSLRLGRPSTGPRKTLITGSSCLQCRPLIVWSENRCGYLLHGAVCSSQPLNSLTESSSSCCLSETSGSSTKLPASPPFSMSLPSYPTPLLKIKPFKRGRKSKWSFKPS